MGSKNLLGPAGVLRMDTGNKLASTVKDSEGESATLRKGMEVRVGCVGVIWTKTISF